MARFQISRILDFGPIRHGLRPDLMRDRKRRSKTKNGVFRSGFFNREKKAILSLKNIPGIAFLKIRYFFPDRKIQIEKRRFSFSISHKIGPNYPFLAFNLLVCSVFSSTLFSSFLLFLLFLFFCFCFVLCSRWSFVDVPMVFLCPADHLLVVPDWQPRIITGYSWGPIGNVKKTHTHTHTHTMRLA